MYNTQDIAFAIIDRIGDEYLVAIGAAEPTYGSDAELGFPFIQFRVAANTKGYTHVRVMADMISDCYMIKFYQFPMAGNTSGVRLVMHDVDALDIRDKLCSELNFPVLATG